MCVMYVCESERAKERRRLYFILCVCVCGHVCSICLLVCVCVRRAQEKEIDYYFIYIFLVLLDAVDWWILSIDKLQVFFFLNRARHMGREAGAKGWEKDGDCIRCPINKFGHNSPCWTRGNVPNSDLHTQLCQTFDSFPITMALRKKHIQTHSFFGYL